VHHIFAPKTDNFDFEAATSEWQQNPIRGNYEDGVNTYN